MEDREGHPACQYCAWLCRSGTDGLSGVENRAHELFSLINAEPTRSDISVSYSTEHYVSIANWLPGCPLLRVNEATGCDFFQQSNPKFGDHRTMVLDVRPGGSAIDAIVAGDND
jgi:hypothetical protein